jgi:ribosomal protein S13
MVRVEIDNIREVKEHTVASNGQINLHMPEYAGHIIKIMILNQKGQIPQEGRLDRNTEEHIERYLSTNRIEGIRHKKGQKRTRETAKQFARLIHNKLDVLDKSQSWIILKNCLQIRYANSVVYERDEGDMLWYSITYSDLIKHRKDGDIVFAFLVRDSDKMVYLKADDVIDELEKAKDLRNNDWLHIHLIFSNGIIKFHVKTGKDNEPIEKEFSREEHYLKWSKFLSILEDN